MDRWKAEMGRVREEKRTRKRKSQKKEDPSAQKGGKRESLRRKKIQVRKEVGKSQNTDCVFPQICGSGGSKSRLAKAAGAEPAGQMRDEKLHAVVARSTFGSQNVQSTTCSDTFGSWDVEKVHAVVARSTFGSQNVQSTSVSEHIWKLRCRKSVCCCSAKHIWKSKCTKHLNVGAHLEVEMSKECMLL